MARRHRAGAARTGIGGGWPRYWCGLLKLHVSSSSSARLCFASPLQNAAPGKRQPDSDLVICLGMHDDTSIPAVLGTRCTPRVWGFGSWNLTCRKSLVHGVAKSLFRHVKNAGRASLTPDSFLFHATICPPSSVHPLPSWGRPEPRHSGCRSTNVPTRSSLHTRVSLGRHWW